VEKKGVDKVKDETLIMADIAEKAIRQIQDFVFELLKERYSEDKARELARVLTEGRWTHDFPITVDVARELGLNVSTSVPEEVYSLMELYPQPITKRHPSVEFIPTPSKQQK
jgi:ClpP class serine protease